MESKKISNGKEFIQPDSILLPQSPKRKRSSRDTHGTYAMHTKKISHHLGTARKAKGYGGPGQGRAGRAKRRIVGFVPRAVVRGLKLFCRKKRV